jgi:hypothetical protein
MSEKGLVKEDWNETQLEEEDSIINKWTQEDVKTLYSLLNNNNISVLQKALHTCDVN